MPNIRISARPGQHAMTQFVTFRHVALALMLVCAVDIAIAQTQTTVDLQRATDAQRQASEREEQRRQQLEPKPRLTVGFGGGVIDTAQSTWQGIEGAAQSSSVRGTTLNGLIAYAKGSNMWEQGKAVANAYQQNGVMGNTGTDGKANPGAAAASGIKVSISLGSANSESHSHVAATKQWARPSRREAMSTSKPQAETQRYGDLRYRLRRT